MVRGSHAVGLVCRLTGIEARLPERLSRSGRVYSHFPFGCGCPAGQPQRAGPVASAPPAGEIAGDIVEIAGDIVEIAGDIVEIVVRREAWRGW